MVLAITLMWNCTKSNRNHNGEIPLTITATFAESRNTKTTLQDGGSNVYWEKGDEIKVFYGDGTGRFVSTNTDTIRTTSFTGSINTVIGSDEGFVGGEQMWGLYPYRQDATYDGTNVITTIPHQQTGKAGSFARNMNISLARSTNLALSFYNVCGGLRFSVKRNDVTDIVFEGRNGENLAGTIKISFEGSIPVIRELSNGQKKITLTAPNSSTFEAGKWYYIILAPGILSDGFKLTFNTSTKYAELSKSDEISIKRGVFGSLENADEGLTYIEKEKPTGNIVFEDNAAKYACISKFDTDKDGYVSYAEAAKVTSIAGLFDDYNTVVTFNELQYFTSLTDIGTAFSNLSNLQTLTLPSGISSIPAHAFQSCVMLKYITLKSNRLTSIGDYAFQGCSSLDTLDLTTSLTSIGEWAFYGCGSLKSVKFPSTLKTIGLNAFWQCYKLESIDLPSSLISIGDNAFNGCKSITSVAIPANVQLGNGVFGGCKSLRSVQWPSNMTVIPFGTFGGCILVDSFSFPENLQSIGDYAFSYCPLHTDGESKVILPSTLKEIGRGNFNGVRNVILQSDEMTTVSDDNTFGPHTKIFVAPSLVEQCKVQKDWSVYAAHIYSRDSYVGDIQPEGTVDLGTSAFWCTKNIGADNPEDYGDYFGWGEIETYYDSQNPLVWKEGKQSGYNWSSYKYCNGTNTTITKYNVTSYYGTVDNKTVLESCDDIASIKYGEHYCIPTIQDWLDLENVCTWEKTTLNSVTGYQVTSPYNGNSIFLPITGMYEDTDLSYIGESSRYWSSSLCKENCDKARTMGITSYTVGGSTPDSRCNGNPIRPVGE